MSTGSLWSVRAWAPLDSGERGGGGHIAYGEHVAVLQSLNAACSTIGVYISLGVCGGEALAEFGDGGFQSGLVAQHADAMPHGVLDAGTIPHLVGGGIVSSSRSGRGGQRDRRMVEHGTGGGVQERFGCPDRVVTVRDGGQTGAASVDEPLEQRVGGKTVGAHDTGTSAFAGRIQAGNGGPGVQIGANASHVVVRGGRHRNRLLAPVEAKRTRIGVDGRESVGQEAGQVGVLAGHRRDVEHHGLAALRLHHAEVLAGHDVTRREFGARIDVLHIPVAMLIQQHRTFAAHGFGDEEVLAHGHGGGMELVELQIGDLGTGTPCDGEAVRGGDRRIGGVRVHTACSTGGQDHPVGGQILVLPVDQQVDAGDVAAPHDEIFEEGVLDDVDARVLAHHGGDVQFKHFAGGVSPGMHHAGARMSRFQAAQHVSMRVAVEVDAGRGELADALRTLTGEDVHGLRVAQAVARGHGVGGMQLRVVVGEDGCSDAALRMIGV